MLFVVSKAIPDSLVGALEERLCEWENSSWAMVREPESSEFEIKGYFESEAAARESWRLLRASEPHLGGEPVIVELAERDWQNSHREFLQPWSHRGLHWVPAWMRGRYPLPAGEILVSLEPGMAFGTGDHPTTRLCARRLLDFRDGRGRKIDRCRVVDAGCGSGILAISAAGLGFGEVFGFDLDPEAVRISRENLRLNGLEGRAHFRVGDLAEGLPERSADIVLCNISAEVVSGNAETLVRALRLAGTLAVSGTLAWEIDRVAHCLSAVAVTVGRKFVSDSGIDGEWADLCLFEI